MEPAKETEISKQPEHPGSIKSLLQWGREKCLFFAISLCPHVISVFMHGWVLFFRTGFSTLRVNYTHNDPNNVVNNLAYKVLRRQHAAFSAFLHCLCSHRFNLQMQLRTPLCRETNPDLDTGCMQAFAKQINIMQHVHEVATMQGPTQ